MCFRTGPGASVCSGTVNKAANTAYCDNSSYSVKVIVVISLYQPRCISLAQGLPTLAVLSYILSVRFSDHFSR